MRFSNVILVLGLGGIAAVGSVAGCSSDTSGGTGGSTGSSSSSGGAVTCAPKDPSCNTVKSDCIALADNKGKTSFALRMAQLDITKPLGLTKPLIKGVVSTGVEMNLDKCNLGGGGTFNLVMLFDTMAKTVTVGGAHPTMDPSKGYTFVNQMIQGLNVAPVMSPVTIDAAGKFAPAKPIDTIVLPIYLGVADKDPSVLLPLHGATITGTLSADQNCIGKYNATGLDPKSGCAPSDTAPAFLTDADLSGYMTLEEADKVVVSSIGQTLCVLISGDATMYGDGGSPTVKCKRDANMKIVFPGDTCSTAGMMCTDSAALAGKLAASAVLNNP